MKRRKLLTAIGLAFFSIPMRHLHAEMPLPDDQDLSPTSLDQSENPIGSISGPVGDFSRLGQYGKPNEPYLMNISGTRIVQLSLAVPVAKTAQNMPVVIIAHGQDQTPSSLWATAAHLASHGFFVITPDISQRGKSDIAIDLHDVLRGIPIISSETGYKLTNDSIIMIGVKDNCTPCIAVTGGVIQGVPTKKWNASCLIAIEPSEQAMNSFETYTSPIVSIFDILAGEDTFDLARSAPSDGMRTLVGIKSLSGKIIDEIDSLDPSTYYWRSYLACTVGAYTSRNEELLSLITGDAYKNITHGIIQVSD